MKSFPSALSVVLSLSLGAAVACDRGAPGAAPNPGTGGAASGGQPATSAPGTGGRGEPGTGGGTGGGGGGASAAGGAGASGSGGSTSAGTGGVVPVDGAPSTSGDAPTASDASGGSSDVASADTWESFARPFMVKYCVSCHDDDKSGDSARDYHMLAVVMREKVDIACGTAKSQADRTRRACSAGAPRAKQFPPGNGPKPTDDERDRLLRWIDANTP